MGTTRVKCLCSAVELELTGKPDEQFYCHCDDCQAISGAAYVGVALFPAASVRVVRGELFSWTYKTLPRLRCESCGTLMMANVRDFGQIGIPAHRLPPHTFQPRFHIRCRYALLPVVDALPHYKDLPAVFGGTDEQVNWAR